MIFLENKADKNGTRYFSVDTIYSIYQKHMAKNSRWFRRAQPTVAKPAFISMYQRWQRESLLRSRCFVAAPNLREPENNIGNEVFAYGVERIIVADDRLKVDVLIKNEKHIEKKALIISSDGYPKYLKAQLQKILGQQPSIRVGFLYDTIATNIQAQIDQFSKHYRVTLAENQIWDVPFKGMYPKKAIKLTKAKKRSTRSMVTPSTHLSSPKDDRPFFSQFIPASILAALGLAALSSSSNTEADNEEASVGMDFDGDDGNGDGDGE